MPTLKLTYFDVKGRGELTRIALTVAGQTFEDKRVNSEEWPKLKQDIPQQQLPILEVDGMVICQSGAIIRYVAREYGLYGDNNIESTKVDIVLSTIEDVFNALAKLFMEKDEDIKKVARKELIDTTIPRFVKIFNAVLCENEGGTAWVVGSKLTVADLALFVMYGILSNFFGPGLEKEKANLKAHADRVHGIPSIKAWEDKSQGQQSNK